MDRSAEVYTGEMIDVFQLDESKIHIEDIAHSLAQKARYNGHAKYFYSVAQHCVLLAQWFHRVGNASVTEVLRVLLHDAAEAYLADLVAPIKCHPLYRPIVELEREVGEKIYQRFRLPWGMPTAAQVADQRIKIDEARVLMRSEGKHWEVTRTLDPLGIDIIPWTWEEAEAQYLSLFAAADSLRQEEEMEKEDAGQ